MSCRALWEDLLHCHIPPGQEQGEPLTSYRSLSGPPDSKCKESLKKVPHPLFAFLALFWGLNSAWTIQKRQKRLFHQISLDLCKWARNKTCDNWTSENLAKTKRGREEGDGTENVINCRKLS